MKTDEGWTQVKDKTKISKVLTTKYLSKTGSLGFSSKNSTPADVRNNSSLSLHCEAFF